MRIFTQSTARNVMVLMVQSADHVTGATGLTLTVTASKDGGAFGSISPTVTERGNGWYSLALTSSHTDTLGDLALQITGSGADPSSVLGQVIAANLNNATSLGLTNLDAAVSSRLATASYTAPDNASIATILTRTDVATSTRMATFTLPTNFSSLSITNGGAVTVGTNQDKTGYTLAQSFPTNFASLAISASGIVSADIKAVNAVTVDGAGTEADPFGPA